MANVIRWYTCPLVANPNQDPASPPVPHSWINSAPGRVLSITLPGNQYCILRINADSTLQDALVGSGAPNGFHRIPLNNTWSQVSTNIQNFILNNWSITANPTDKLALIVYRLATLSNSIFTIANSRMAGVEDGVGEE